MAKATSMRKRIAAVAAVVVGMGALTVAPASAADINVGYQYVTSISLAQATASKPIVGDTVVVNMGAVTTATPAPGSGDNAQTFFAGYLSTVPAGASTAVTADATGADLLCATAADCTATAAGKVIKIYGDNNKSILGATGKTAAAGSAYGSFSFSPDTVGTYVLTVFNDANNDGTVGALEASKTITVTVTAPALSVDKSTVTLATTQFAATAATTTDVVAIYAPRTVASSPVSSGNVTVSVKNTANQALTVAAISVSISGPGLVGFSSSDRSTAAVSKTDLDDDSETFYFWSDGEGGKSTVTVKATTYNGDTVTLGTFNIYYYGTVTKLTATSRYSAYDPSVAGVPVRVLATDANDVAVPGLTVAGATGNPTTQLSAWACTERAVINTTTAAQVPGSYNCTPGTYADAEGTGSYAFSTVVSATSTITSAAVNVFKTSSTIAAVAVSFDKTSYTPGAPVVMTIKATNAAGNPVADNGTYTLTSISGAGLALTSVSFTPGTFNLMAAAGEHQVKFLAPFTEGDYVVTVARSATIVGTSTMKVVPAPSVAAIQAQIASITATVTSLQTAMSTLVASVTATLTALTAKINKIMAKLKIK